MTSNSLPRISAAALSFPTLQRSRVPRRTSIISCLQTFPVSSNLSKQLSKSAAAVCWISSTEGSTCLPSSVPARIWKSLQQLSLPKLGVSPTQISTVSVPGIFSEATTRVSRQLPELSSCSSLCQTWIPDSMAAVLPAKTNLLLRNLNS